MCFFEKSPTILGDIYDIYVMWIISRGSFLWAAAPPVSLSEVTGVHMTSMAVLLLGGSSRVTEAGGTGRLAAVATRYGETSAKLSSSTPLMASTRYLHLRSKQRKAVSSMPGSEKSRKKYLHTIYHIYNT